MPLEINGLMKCSTCGADKPFTEFRLLCPSARARLHKRDRDWSCKTCTTENARKDSIIHRRKTQLKVFTHYSGGDPKCSCCGEENIKFLTMDHVNNDGKEHRDRVGGTHQIARDLIRRGFPPEIIISCYNCNLGRQRNGGICPHEEERRIAQAVA